MLTVTVVGELRCRFTVRSSSRPTVPVTGIRQLKTIETVRSIFGTSLRGSGGSGRVYRERSEPTSPLIRVGSPSPLTKGTRTTFGQPRLGSIASVGLVSVARGRVPPTLFSPLTVSFCKPQLMEILTQLTNMVTTLQLIVLVELVILGHTPSTR